MNKTAGFMGFRREDGRVGVRNHVAVVSTVFCGSSVARRIADATGAMVFTHDGGCGQLGPEKEHHLRVLKGVITHPNVGAVLVVGLGCEQFDADVADFLAPTALDRTDGNPLFVAEALRLVEHRVGLSAEEVTKIWERELAAKAREVIGARLARLPKLLSKNNIPNFIITITA